MGRDGKILKQRNKTKARTMRLRRKSYKDLLQLYLDTKDQRKKLMEDWEKKFEPTEEITKK